MALTTYLEKKILDNVFSQASMPTLTSLYFGLFTATPNDSGGGTEVSGSNYSRVTVTNNSTNFPAASGSNPSSKGNGTAITFPQASGSWGTVTHFGIFDAASAGNLLFWGALTTSKPVTLNDTPAFNASDLAITLD